MPRTTAARRVSIRPFTASLKYASSTATDLGSADTLNTTMPWAVAFWFDLGDGIEQTGANGYLQLRTDQAIPVLFFFQRSATISSTSSICSFGSTGTFARWRLDNSWEKYSRGWHNSVVTFDGIDRTAIGSYVHYLDGVSQSMTAQGASAATAYLNTIGRLGASFPAFMSMADLKIWNGGTAMTAAQVADFYYENIYPTGPTLIRDYPHTDGAGLVLTDITGNADGTIGTSTWSSINIPNKTRATAAARTVATARTVAS